MLAAIASTNAETTYVTANCVHTFCSGNLSNRNDVTGTLMDQTERSLLVGRNYELNENFLRYFQIDDNTSFIFRQVIECCYIFKRSFCFFNLFHSSMNKNGAHQGNQLDTMCYKRT